MLLEPATPVMIGIRGLSRWLQDRGATRVVIVRDPVLAPTAFWTEVTAALEWGGAVIDVIDTPADTGLSGIAAVADRLAGHDVVVSLGGGATLDVVKVAVELLTNPRTQRTIGAAGRSGVIFLNTPGAPAIRHVAIPTTIGTGSERGPRACLVVDGRKRLLFGSGLQPDLAVLDAGATRTLPAALVLEGVLENVVRQSGAFVGDLSPDAGGIEDELLLTVVRRSVAVGDRLRTSTLQGATADADRLEAAKLSAWAQSPEFTNPTRDPFANKGWYLSNELSTMFGVRKVAAFAAVVPPWWRRILDGDRRWGSRERLLRLWGEVGAVRDIADDPVVGFEQLVSEWGVAMMPAISAADATRVAHQIVHAWGRGLPALGTLDQACVEAVMADLPR